VSAPAYTPTSVSSWLLVHGIKKGLVECKAHACGPHAVSGDGAPLNLIMNPIDIGQLNNSNRKTWNWSIRYGIDQLNSPIDQSLVLMVTMKHIAYLIAQMLIVCLDIKISKYKTKNI
jgi:hypothetical protein